MPTSFHASGVAVELDVKIPSAHARSDTELAQAAQSALAWNVVVPADKVRIKAEKGWLTLSGELDWEYQRNAAASVVRIGGLSRSGVIHCASATVTGQSVVS